MNIKFSIDLKYSYKDHVPLLYILLELGASGISSDQTRLLVYLLNYFSTDGVKSRGTVGFI